jgi:tetratricopeptide (TPR) repeat protein
VWEILPIVKIAVYANNLGFVLGNQGDLLGAKKCFVRALKIDMKTHGPDHPLVAKRLNNLGAILVHLFYPFGAKRCFLRALGINMKFYGSEHYEVGLNLLNLGDLQKSLGEDEAQESIDKGTQILKKRYGNELAIKERMNRRQFSVL